MRNYSNESDVDLHENGREGETHFHMNGFARRVTVTRKWAITFYIQVKTALYKNSYKCEMQNYKLNINKETHKKKNSAIMNSIFGWYIKVTFRKRQETSRLNI